MVWASRPISSCDRGLGHAAVQIFSADPLDLAPDGFDRSQCSAGHDPRRRAEEQHQERERDQEEALQALDAVVHPIERCGDVHRVVATVVHDVPDFEPPGAVAFVDVERVHRVGVAIGCEGADARIAREVS